MNLVLISLLLLYISSFQLTQNRILTQEDYTLYFDEYNFDWSNVEDWHVITADNTQKSPDGKSFTKIVACTLHMDGVSKNLCVHTKSEGGFTLKFQDFPHQPDARWTNVDSSNAAHTNIDNDFETFLRSQSIHNDDDIYDIELDFFNDDDWSEISAIWNWNINENKQHKHQHKLYHDYTQYMHNHDDNIASHPKHRRLVDENAEEEEFLGSKKRRRRRADRRRERRWRRRFQMYGRYGMLGAMQMQHHNNPMSRMMQQMMQMQMMMKMMNGMMGSHRRRLVEDNEEEEEFLGFGGKKKKRRRRERRRRRRRERHMMHMQHMQMQNPMTQMMQQMMQMQMMMKMMNGMMGSSHRRREPCCAGADVAQTDDYSDYDDIYDGYQHEYDAFGAQYNDFGDFYNGYQAQNEDLYDDLNQLYNEYQAQYNDVYNNWNLFYNQYQEQNYDSNQYEAHNYDYTDLYSDLQNFDSDENRRRLYDMYPSMAMGGNSGMNGGRFGKMMTKIPQMMMNMAMMKSMGNMMKGMNPYLAMMMMNHMTNTKPKRRRKKGSKCGNTCNTYGSCGCHRSSMNSMMNPMMGGYNHLPMHMMNGMMPHRYMMNPMQMQLGMPGMQGMHGMHMNPMMAAMMSGSMQGGMQGMDPMMMGLMAGMMAHPTPKPVKHHHDHKAAPAPKVHKQRAIKQKPTPLIGGMSKLGEIGSKLSPMFNVNMGYMMGRAVKKCQPLKNGLEICAMYNPMTNQLNIDVKCKNCKKLKKGKPKRLFPKKLSKMIKMLVKQRVFGKAGDDLLGGELQRRFRRKVGLKKKAKGSKGAKGAKGPKGAPGAMPPNAAQMPMGPTGANGVGGGSFGRRRMMVDDEDYDLVQFDTMEGNIGYSMWRAEQLDWHTFKDYEEGKEDDVFVNYGEYSNFGNFVHYFDRFELNWNNDENWSDVDYDGDKEVIQFGDEALAMDLGQKCGHKLPFLNFKLCSKVADHEISVFFKRSAMDNNAAAAYMDENEFYYEYFDELLDDDAHYEYNDVKTLQSIIEYEFEHSLFHFSNDEDWHEIITSFPASAKHRNRRNLVEIAPIEAGERLGEHTHKQTEIELFGHLYRLHGISKCGGGSDSPRFCVGIHLGEAIKLPKSISLPMSKMCNFMYIAKVCLGFDPNTMELKLSIQFQSIHKWKGIAKKILSVIKHLPHKLKRYTKWASKASAISAAKRVEAGDIYNYYDDDDEEVDDDVMDGWYDSKDNKQWLISSAKVDADNMYLDDGEIWNADYTQYEIDGEIMEEEQIEKKNIATITTDKGHKVERKCMHMMGGRLCLCQFLSWMDSPQYHCHPEEGFLIGGIMGGAIASAKGLDLNIYDYIDMNYYGDDNMYDTYGSNEYNYGDMSEYYDVIGPQIKMEDVIGPQMDENKNENDIYYERKTEDDETFGAKYEDDDILLYDDIQNEDINDEIVDGEYINDNKQQEWNAYDFYDIQNEDINDEIVDDEYINDNKQQEWNAYDFYDANYDSSNKKQYEYDYDYYFGDIDNKDDDDYNSYEFKANNRWIQHRDDPSELQKIQHPQQQKHSEHNLFIYNEYDDDITYLQKKYDHKNNQEEESDDEEEEESLITFNFDSWVEINANLFWLLSLLAIFFGCGLCSVIMYYFKKRQAFIKEFAKQIEPFIITSNHDGTPIKSIYKYGFMPVNVPLKHDNDSDDDDANNNQLLNDNDEEQSLSADV